MTERRLYRVVAPERIRLNSETPLTTAALYINAERVGFVELAEIKPRYRLGADHASVVDTAASAVVAAYGPEHPDREAAASLECVRLNEQDPQ